MSGNSAKVSEKSGKRPKLVGMVRNFVYLGKFDCGTDTFSDHHISYLYFIRTVIHFSYLMFTENLD